MMTNPSRVAFSLFGRDIYWYGILIAAAVVIGLVIAMRSAKHYGWDQDTLIDFALWAVPSAVVGARLYYVAFEWPMFQNDLLKIFRIWEGGLAIYGGVIGGVICALIFCKCRKLSFWTLADIVAPALALGQAIGRWGNFFNQEAYGAAVTNPSLMWFPMAVRIDATNTIHYATFFYESMWCLLHLRLSDGPAQEVQTPGRCDAPLFDAVRPGEGLRGGPSYRQACTGELGSPNCCRRCSLMVTAVFMMCGP